MHSDYFSLQQFAEDTAGSSLATSTSVADDYSAGASAESDAGQNLDGTSDQESFDSLIHGRYAKEYNEAVKDAISKRFKNQKDLQATLDKVNPIMAVFADKYGIRPGDDGSIDYDALAAKVNEDDSFYEEEAFRRGMSVSDLKQIKSMERENATLRRQQEEIAREAEQRREFDKLVAQGEEIKQMYPSFDLGTELGNDQFMHLLTNGVDMKTAYEVCHNEEILASGMAYAVERTRENTSRAIQSGMGRPAENGLQPKATADVTKIDPSRLTLEQMKEINERAARGERITFR